jgi:5-methylcytosine-specific restriction protein B
MYALFRPVDENTRLTEAAVKGFLDLAFEERGQEPLKGFEQDKQQIEDAWSKYLMPSSTRQEVRDHLRERHFVILQGPPGTGKTKLANDLLKEEYFGNGKTVQFHPNTTYEAVIGGLAPTQTKAEFGLAFTPTPGALMQAAIDASTSDKPYLLNIDEINRADLGKVLGEAIYLLEWKDLSSRKIALPYEFKGIGTELSLPTNLHILGTMNSADRSIAMVDVAVRRRFAFVSLWPQADVVNEKSCSLMREAFSRLRRIFVENASDDGLALMPGHSYFLESNEAAAPRRLRTELAPLLEEYLAQGYVARFSEQIRSYLQWLQSQ